MRILVIILSFAVLPSLRGQQFSLVDVVAGRAVTLVQDFQISPDGKRYYSTGSAIDTLLLNQVPILVDPLPPGPFIFPKSYLLSANIDGSPNFIKFPSGPALALKGESILSFVGGGKDTTFTSDTFFLKKGPPVSDNLYILEHSSNGTLIQAKQFVAQYNSVYSVTEAEYKNGHLYVSGEASNATLTLGSLTMPLNWGGNQDGFVARFDEDLNPEWITRVGGFGDDYCQNVAVNSQGKVATAGNYTKHYLIACNDTVQGLGDDMQYLLMMDSSGQCDRLESCDGGSVGASDVQWLDDEHIICSGEVSSPQVFIGGVAYQNTSASGTGFIVKTRYEKQADIDVLMLTGNKNQSIFSIATTPQGDIWICGRYYSDTLGIGPFKLPRRGSTEKLDAFVAKLDKNLKPLFAASIGGSDTDQALAIKYGPDGHLYVLLQTYSPELDINGQPFYQKQYYKSEHLLLRIKDTTSVGAHEAAHGQEIVRISPNPASSQVHLSWPLLAASPDARLLITDVFGRQAAELRVAAGEATHTLDVSGLASGLYFVTVTDKGKPMHKGKFVVQH